MLSGKAVNETVITSMEFSPVLTDAETLSGASVAVSLYDGSTAVTTSMLVGSPTISGTVVTQTVTGGADAHIYRLRYTVTTSLGRVLIASSFLPIDEDD